MNKWGGLKAILKKTTLWFFTDLNSKNMAPPEKTPKGKKIFKKCSKIFKKFSFWNAKESGQ